VKGNRSQEGRSVSPHPGPLPQGEGEREPVAAISTADSVSTESAFLDAAFPAPVRLLGQDLEPYSLIHEMLLRQHGNVFLEPSSGDWGSERIISHLFMGAFICCHRYPELLTMLRRPDLPEISREWREEFKSKSKKKHFEEVVERVRLFRRYVNEGQACPEFSPIKRRGARPNRGGSPWLLRLFKTLTGHLNFSPTEAYNCPYGYAQWLYLGHWEGEGTVRIVTIEEKQKEKLVHLEAAKLGLKVLRFSHKSKGVDQSLVTSAATKEGA
jgi:hypothetical protein